MRVYQALRIIKKIYNKRTFSELVRSYKEKEIETSFLPEIEYDLKDKTKYIETFSFIPIRIFLSAEEQLHDLSFIHYFSKVYKVIPRKIETNFISNFIDFIKQNNLAKIEIDRINYTYKLTREDSKVAIGNFSESYIFDLEKCLTEVFQDWSINEDKSRITLEKEKLNLDFIDYKDLLIIEDNKLFSSVLSKFFEKNNISSKFVSSFTEGLNLILNNSYKAIITDYKIGIELADQYIKKIREVKPDIPLFVLSSATEANIKLSCLSSGADLFIEKAEDPRVVLAYLDKIAK